jgi:ankyrin repeat protein
VHPETAGVQLSLIELLIDRGARIDGAGLVNACLHNGRGQAAELLAKHGAPLDLEGAAGTGRLELVASFFDHATQQQIEHGFGWACEFGHAKVVKFLLAKGIAVNARLKPHGQTGLHWAAYGGHAGIVKLLLDRGASVDAKDNAFDGTPLDWALHQSKTFVRSAKHRRHYQMVARLLKA